MTYPIVLDLETQYSFQEVGNDCKKLRISVVGIYNYATGEFESYKETELSKLFSLLERASVLIGFNIKKFDLQVLSAYYVGNVNQFPTFDILEEIEKILGHRVSLDDLCRATLGSKKSGHGFLAIDYFRKGEWDKLIQYCLDDVRLTRDIFEYGKKEKKLYFHGMRGKQEIPVSFADESKKKSTVALSLPF